MKTAKGLIAGVALIALGAPAFAAGAYYNNAPYNNAPYDGAPAAHAFGSGYRNGPLQSDALLRRISQIQDQVRRTPMRRFHGPRAVHVLNQLQAIKQDVLLARRRGVLTPVAYRNIGQRLDNVQFELDRMRAYRA